MTIHPPWDWYLLALQTKKAMDVGRPGRISVEDIIFLIRKDPKKYSRVKELLMMNEELRKARKAFDEIKYATTKWKLSRRWCLRILEREQSSFNYGIWLWKKIDVLWTCLGLFGMWIVWVGDKSSWNLTFDI